MADTATWKSADDALPATLSIANSSAPPQFTDDLRRVSVFDLNGFDEDAQLVETRASIIHPNNIFRLSPPRARPEVQVCVLNQRTKNSM